MGTFAVWCNGENVSAALPAARVTQISGGSAADGAFQALVAKTNLYAKALTDLSSVHRSYDRYSSWVDAEKGFTGREFYISYGLYEISDSVVDALREAAAKGPQMQPPLPELDPVIMRVSDAVSALAPLVKRASTYYKRQDYKDDEAKLGKELHAQMMPLFERIFAAEVELRSGVDAIKAQLNREQLTQLEKASGRNYEWHLRSFMMAAKSIVALLPPSPDSPAIAADAYRSRDAELESAYTALELFALANPDEIKKIRRASLVETRVKDFLTASRFLRRTLESPQMDRREYVERIGSVAKSYKELLQCANTFR